MTHDNDEINDWHILPSAPGRDAPLDEPPSHTEGARRQRPNVNTRPEDLDAWHTSLMGDALNILQALADTEHVRNSVKTICVEDDVDESEEISTPSESAVIWPRHEDGRVVTEALGIGPFKSMLAARRLCPERLEIRDKRNSRDVSDPDNAALLARDILDGSGLVSTAFSIRKDSPMSTIITAELSPEHQGQQGIGLFSLLRKAELCLSRDLSSYWAEKILFHAPLLKELSLSFSSPAEMPRATPLVPNNASLPSLEKLEMSSAMLSGQSIVALLDKSKQTLTGISFRFTTLTDDSKWSDVLNHVANGFPRLAWFKLLLISEGSIGQSKITFPALLDMDSAVSEPYRDGLKLVERGPAGNRRITGVEYEGDDAGQVLRIVAGFAVMSAVGGSIAPQS